MQNTPTSHNVTSTVEKVGPEVARMYLARNTKNRPVSERYIEYLARQIRDGRWRTTNQGIGFDRDNVLIDGQHRLHAIERAGREVDIIVARNLDPEARGAVDGGRGRTDYDRIKLEGYEGYTKKMIQLAKRVIRGISNSPIKVSPEELVDFVDRYRDAFDFVIGAMPQARRAISKVTVLAPIVRAYIVHGESARLDVFCQAMDKTIINPEFDCTAPLRLFAWVSEHGVNVGGKNRKDREIYIKVEMALRAFIERRGLEKLMLPRKIREIFPIDEDDMGINLSKRNGHTTNSSNGRPKILRRRPGEGEVRIG